MSEDPNPPATDLIRWTFSANPDHRAEIESHLDDLGLDVLVRNESQFLVTWDEPEGNLDEVIEAIWAINGAASLGGLSGKGAAVSVNVINDHAYAYAADSVLGQTGGALTVSDQGAVIAQAAEHFLAAPERRKASKDELQRLPHLVVRIFDDLAIGTTQQARGEGLPVRASFHLPLPARGHSQVEDMQFGFTEQTAQA